MGWLPHATYGHIDRIDVDMLLTLAPTGLC